jgi:hypothetical protein
MQTNEKTLPRVRINNLKAQGYTAFSDCEITEFAWGNRFASILSGITLLIGLLTTSISTLIALNIIIAGGLLLPNSPFDYIYNFLLSNVLNKPKIPPRSKQAKFSLLIAFLWLNSTIALFYFEYTLFGYIMGVMLLSVSALVSTTDFCIPAVIYNLLYKIKIKK